MALVDDKSEIFYTNISTATTTSTFIPEQKPEEPTGWTTQFIKTTEQLIPSTWFADDTLDYDPEIDGNITHLWIDLGSPGVYWHDVSKYGNTFTLNLDNLYVFGEKSTDKRHLSRPDLYANVWVGSHNGVDAKSNIINETTLVVNIISYEEYGSSFNVEIYCGGYYQIALVYICPGIEHQVTWDDYEYSHTPTTTTNEPSDEDLDNDYTQSPSPFIYTTRYVNNKYLRVFDYTTVFPLEDYDPDIHAEIINVYHYCPRPYVYWHNAIKDGNTLYIDLWSLCVELTGYGHKRINNVESVFKIYTEPADSSYKMRGDVSFSNTGSSISISFSNYEEEFGQALYLCIADKRNLQNVYQLAIIYVTPDNTHEANYEDYVTSTFSPSTTRDPNIHNRTTIYPSVVPNAHYTPQPWTFYEGGEICYIDRISVDKKETQYNKDIEQIEICGYIVVALEQDRHPKQMMWISDDRISYSLYDDNGKEYLDYPGVSFIQSGKNDCPLLTLSMPKNMDAVITNSSTLIIGAKIEGFNYGSYASTKYIPIHYIRNVK